MKEVRVKEVEVSRSNAELMLTAQYALGHEGAEFESK